MARYRDALPQLGGGLFLTDGGLETSMIALEGFDLREFAAFPLLDGSDGEAALRRYFRSYVEIARRHGAGLILESATWRASADWGVRLGFTPGALADLDRQRHRSARRGPRRGRARMRPARRSAAASGRGATATICRRDVRRGGRGVPRGADRGLRRHRRRHGRRAHPDVRRRGDRHRARRRASRPAGRLSFTVETDGRLASGKRCAAIEAVDDGHGRLSRYYMINCAHPSHFAPSSTSASRGPRRIRGLRANASRLSHARARRAPRARRGRPRGAGPRVRGAQAAAAASERLRRLLRHRSSPPRAHRRGLRTTLLRGDMRCGEWAVTRCWPWSQ